MKKISALLACIGYLTASSLQMPPSIPGVEKKENASKPQICKTVPPMLQIMPPPLQNAVDKCQSLSNIPSKQQVLDLIQKENIKYKKITIKPLEGFVKLYEIDLNNGKKLYCNEKIECFEGVRLD